MFDPARRLLGKQAGQSLLEADASQLAMVGDTLNTDILGGARYGATTIWFNETGFHHTSDLQFYPEARPTCHLPGVWALLDLLRTVASEPRAAPAEEESSAGSGGLLTLVS